MRNLTCSCQCYFKRISPTCKILPDIVSTRTSCIEIAPDFVVWSRSSLGKWKIPNETRVARCRTSSPLHICGQNPRRTDETLWSPKDVSSRKNSVIADRSAVCRFNEGSRRRTIGISSRARSACCPVSRADL